MNDGGHAGRITADMKRAETLGRFFNMAFNSALLYGGGHQSTIDNSAAFHAQLAALFGNDALQTMLIERESVYFESCCVDKVVNARRIASYCKKAGIQSISFEKEVDRAEIQGFMRIVGDLRENPSVEAMQRSMQTSAIRRIRINYIVYRKMTADEAVVDKQSASATGGGKIPDEETRRQRGPSPEFSLKNMLVNPNVVTDALKPGRQDEAGAGIEAIVNQLRALTGQVSGETRMRDPLTASELAEAVAILRSGVLRSIDTLKAAGSAFAGADPVTEELDNLSRETIIRIVRDEYRHGGVSVKRLAQIIRRILPDARELKPLLPRLRKALTADGMSLADYLQLVNSLVRQLGDEGLTEGLTLAAQDMGVSADEIIANIKADPGEAARLIVLASELKGGNGGGDRLSDVIAEYVEQAGRKLAKVSEGGAEGAAVSEGHASPKRYQAAVLDELRKHGVEDGVVKRIAQKLSLKERGYELPKGVFDIKVTTFFLDNEIKRHVRYKTPFSVIVISLIALEKEGGGAMRAAPQDAALVIPNTLTTVKQMLRDLDLVGVMAWISVNVPFIILPMTDEAGAAVVKIRLNRELNKIKMPSPRGGSKPVFLVTAHAFDPAKTPDRDSFIKSALTLHAAEVERLCSAWAGK